MIDQFKVTVIKNCAFATIGLDSTKNTNLQYDINFASPTTDIISLADMFTTDDNYCTFTYLQTKFDTSNILTPQWADNSNELGTSQDASVGDWIWQVSGEDKIRIKTGDNANEANSLSTSPLSGPIKLIPSVTDGANTKTGLLTLTIFPDCSQETVTAPVSQPTTQ